jgi:hypothetical protein
MEVIKIRLQAQHHSMADPLDIPKYRNAAHALYTVVREEGFGALYRGVSLTALRQGSNQAVNFTAYSEFRAMLQKYHGKTDLPGYETMLIGLVSGAMGPLSNAPIDTIKTRLQKTPAEPGQTAMGRITAISRLVEQRMLLDMTYNVQGYVEARRKSKFLQGYHTSYHACRAWPSCHIHRIRIPEGRARKETGNDPRG